MSGSYTFPKGSREASPDRNNSPGPNNYDDSLGVKMTHDRPPEWSFARGDRTSFGGDGGAGPGSYDSPVRIAKGGLTIQGRENEGRSNSREKAGQLGPGSYDIVNLNKSPNYTIGTKLKEPKKLDAPGPGAYERIDMHQSQMNSQKSKKNVAFGSNAKRDNFVGRNADNSLGPGQYSQEKEFNKHSNPTFGFSKEPRMKQKVDMSPGPGSYSQNQGINDSSKKMTIGGGGKPPVNGSNDFMSPVKTNKKMAPALSKTPRTASHQKIGVSNIGPGAYEASDFLTRDRSPNVNFGTTTRTNFVNKDANDRPGPGNYEVGPKSESKAFTMGGRPQQKVNKEGPGPGNYNPDSKLVKDTSKVVSFGKSSKPSNMAQSKSTAQLGSGTQEDFGKHGAKASLRGTEEKKIHRDNSGPGDYNPNHDVIKYKAPSVTFAKDEKKDKSGQKDKSSHRQDRNSDLTYQAKEQSFGSGKPKITFGSRVESAKKLNVPGPGAYEAKDIITKYNNPSFRQSSSTRQEMVSKQTKEMPGPGNYADESKSFGKGVPTYTFGQKREQKIRDDSPGPGAYQAKETVYKESVRSFKMGNQSRPNMVSKENSSLPGPGIYDNAPLNSGPSFSFHPAKEQKSRHDSPGPGAYDSESHTVTKDRVISFKMGDGKRSELVSKERISQIGPGQYSSNQRTIENNDSRKVQIQGKSNERRLDTSPGPGHYQAKDDYVKDTAKSVLIQSQSQRADLVQKQTRDMPGPGSYESPHRIGKDCQTHTFSGKGKERRDEKMPGPGSYEKNEDNVRHKSPSFKMGNSQRVGMVDKLLSDMPGPGNYTQSSLFGKAGPHVTISGKDQKVVKQNQPGPGDYDYNQKQVKDNLIGFKFGDNKTERSQMVTKERSGQPGPGAYDKSNEFGKDVLSFKISGKGKETQRNDSPGPGIYEPQFGQSKDRVVSYKMGNTKRADLVSHELRDKPGPGNYESPEKSMGPKYTMGSKKQIDYKSDSPGPGGYEPTQSVSKDRVISYKIGSTTRQDLVSKNARDLPGPGNYESSLKYNGPQFTMGSKREVQQRTNSPGPGGYEQDIQITRDRAISYKIGSTSRNDIVAKSSKELPGPGTYESPQKRSGPNYTMGGKKEINYTSDSPGPAGYEPSMSASKERIVAHKIGATNRKEIISKQSMELPGPGNYDSPTRQTGPHFTMGSKREVKQRDNSPGPGGYEPNINASRDKAVSFQMGKTQRNDIVSKQAMELPGPGIYDQSSQFGKGGPKVTIGGKKREMAPDSKPGPGYYEPVLSQNKTKIVSHKIDTKTSRSQLVSKEENSKPGPGMYDSPHGLGKGTKYTIGQKREDVIKNDSPGPGMYEASQSASKDRVVSHKISLSQRIDMVDKESGNKPGPGVYDRGDKFGDNAKKVSIMGKGSEQKPQMHPGPGSYNAKDFLTKDNNVKNYSMGKTNRQDLVSNGVKDLPGPGNYSDSKQFGANAKAVTILGRPRDSSKNDSPGPGNYESQDHLTRYNSPSAKISKTAKTSSILTPEKQFMPAPGQYDDGKGFGKDVKSFQIRGKPTEQRQDDIPGPGTYEDSHNAVKERVRGAKISEQRHVSRRVDVEVNNGPGMYDPKLQNNSPTFEMRGRPKDRVDNNLPGPGSYNENPNNVRDRTRSANFSNSPERDTGKSWSPNRDNNVGPGMYDSRDYDIQGGHVICYTIPKNEREPGDDGTPGPGHYKLPYKLGNGKDQWV